MQFIGSASHGTAVWVSQLFRDKESLRSENLFYGVISGERMAAGYDIDDLVKDLWSRVVLTFLQYMETNLMLSSGKAICIQSTRIDGVVSCVGVMFDEKFYPSGLTGRFLDEFVKREGCHGKEEGKSCGSRGTGRRSCRPKRPPLDFEITPGAGLPLST